MYTLYHIHTYRHTAYICYRQLYGTFIHTYIYKYIHTYIYIYTYIHTYTHTYIQDARLARENDLIKQSLKLYDDELEKYIPVLMAQARIYWDREHYPMVSTYTYIHTYI